VELTESMVRKDHPRRPVNHIRKFVAKEIEELVGRLMGATCHGVITLLEGPRGGGEDNREAAAAEVLEKRTRRVIDACEGGQVALAASRAK
jgi:hypothetical protein